MNGLPYYQRYPRDFFEGTAGMRFELKAAYGLVLDAIYMQGGALPDDARYIAGLLGCSVRKWNSLRKELLDLGKIYAAEGVISENLFKKKYRRPAVPTEISRSVFKRDGEKCVYCGDEAGPFHLDHIEPWSRDGEHSIENLAVSCASCNLSKGDKTIGEWRNLQ